MTPGYLSMFSRKKTQKTTATPLQWPTSNSRLGMHFKYPSQQPSANKYWIIDFEGVSYKTIGRAGPPIDNISRLPWVRATLMPAPPTFNQLPQVGAICGPAKFGHCGLWAWEKLRATYVTPVINLWWGIVASWLLCLKLKNEQKISIVLILCSVYQWCIVKVI